MKGHLSGSLGVQAYTGQVGHSAFSAFLVSEPYLVSWFQFKAAYAVLLKLPIACMTILGQNDPHIITKFQAGDSLVNQCWP